MSNQYLAFIDESGDHNLNVLKLDNYYNIFVLGSVIFKKDDYEFFDKEFRKLKLDLFGSDEFILHTAEITRPNKSKNEKNLLFNNPEFRNSFYSRINSLLEKIPCIIVSCIIRKDKLLQKYGYQSEDPYLFSYENLLNRIMRVAGGGSCDVFPEKRSSVENIKLEAEMLKLKTMGSAFYSGSEIQNRISSFVLRDKKNNDSGLQLADLIVTPIGRYINGKAPRSGNEISYSIIKSKIPEWGITIFP